MADAVPHWHDGYRKDLEYTLGVYTFLNPDLLLMNAVMRGVRPCTSITANDEGNPRRLVYCDLGCGQGITTNLMAARDPDGQYFGIDYSATMIANARSLAADAKLGNVTFLEMSFANLHSLDIPDCDVIVLHGIWSWIDPALRQPLTDFIARKLKPGGLCFVSYNCAVGRNDDPMRQLLRLAERTSRQQGEARILEAVTMANAVAKGGAKFFRHNPGTAERLASLPGKGARYVAHEYLNDAWHPTYFKDVAGQLSKAGLGYVGSADLVWNRNDLSLPDEAYPLLQRLSAVEDVEFIKDIWAGNAFRKDIFVKGRTILSAVEQEKLLAPLRFAAIRPRDLLKTQIEVPVGFANLDPALFGKVFDRLQQGPVSGNELADLARSHGSSLLQVLEPLLIANYIALCAPESAGRRITESLARFDDAVQALNRKGQDLHVVSLPGLATATALLPLDYLIWQAGREGSKNRAQAVFDQMKRVGRKVVHNGDIVDDENQALKLLADTVKLYDMHVAPVLIAG